MASHLRELEALDRAVRRRDVMEYAAACLVIAIFGWRAATGGDPLVRLGALIVVFGSMFIILWSRVVSASSRQSSGWDLPLAAFCEREVARVDAQIRLLRSVWWWYVAPTLIGLLIMTIAGERSTTFKAVASTAYLLVGWIIVRLNWTAAERELVPLRTRMNATLAALRRES